ncbi:NADPH-dependent FMN reductase [Beutenbergia cavernae DSM 12333]|uniref:NADPH-dependent FMN reductase n=1 Tax=Beutenbergia cavernae (strain ATCC BAA-8 / DSM 12333 / CCUG 43141 / JCM 11478 / NBRC 16432 / NCIMB 13614 / HKI 0122) TaxID=471853 RepID=C5C2U9_BEUC1|nr:NAD(P)H-dependent oxidoreductase [Beutenbergia cavernae]ACQ81793.1 NADPH-dependent FMN reductase [Beutenbergia cavernae DSM 12333]
MVHIGIIIGSTRPGRRGADVAHWVLDQASKRHDATFEIIDLVDHPLPHLDEAMPPRLVQYEREHTRQWSAHISRFDGFVIVTPEYNHAPPAVLKNALDFLFHEWANKAVGFVGYGAVGGARAVEQLRLVAGELQLADVQAQVALSLYTDFEAFATLTPQPAQEAAVETLLDQVVAWSEALAPLREAAREPVAAGASR